MLEEYGGGAYYYYYYYDHYYYYYYYFYYYYSCWAVAVAVAIICYSQKSALNPVRLRTGSANPSQTVPARV